jgi:hypothetical protein
MSYSNRLAALGDVYVQEHDRSMPDWPDYTAQLLAPVPHLAGNWAPIVHLDGCTPDEIRAFAAALVQVADRLESVYAPSEG